MEQASSVSSPGNEDSLMVTVRLPTGETLRLSDDLTGGASTGSSKLPIDVEWKEVR